jgi:hypothetical protein
MKPNASTSQGSFLVAGCLVVPLASRRTVPTSPQAASAQPTPVAASAAPSARDAALAEVAPPRRDRRITSSTRAWMRLPWHPVRPGAAIDQRRLAGLLESPLPLKGRPPR